MKWTIHKPKDCDIGKKNANNQGNNNTNQNNQPQNTARQVTYAEIHAQLALQSINEWWCAPAWLALGFLAMAEPTIVSLTQAIFILTFPSFFSTLLISTWQFLAYLEAHAPSTRHLHHKLWQFKSLPARRRKRSGKKKRFCEIMMKRKQKMPILTHRLVWAAFRVGCCVVKALRVTKLQLRKAASHASNMISRIKTKMSHHEIKFLAQESHFEQDSPTYLAHFDIDSFRIGVDTLCTRTLSGNKEHFEDLHLYKGKEVTGISGGLEIVGEGTFVFNIQSDDGIVDTIKIPRSLYVPGIKLPLLSPQHWAETAGDNSPVKFGTKIEVDEEGCILLWKQQTRRKRITHDPLTKTPIFRTAPGTRRYQVFEAT